MRTFLLFFLFTVWAATAIASLPLTAKEIGLMLRSGYSNEAVTRELVTRHFAGRLDSAEEAQLLRAGAKPPLIVAIQSGSYAASPSEISDAEAKRNARQREMAVAPHERETTPAISLAKTGAGPQVATATTQPRATTYPSDAMQRFFENELVSLNGGDLRTFDDRALSGKRIFLFFISAHLIEPLRHFTPRLIEYYNRVAPQHPELQIIFFSQDRSLFDMQSYMRETDMPWPALAFDRIQTKFPVVRQPAALPELILVAGDGRTLFMSVGAENSQVEKIFADMDEILATSKADPRTPFPQGFSKKATYFQAAIAR